MAERKDGLQRSLRALTQAQIRTQAHIDELVKAQRRTEKRIDHLEDATKELVKAQTRTERALHQLSSRTGVLEEAQIRTQRALQQLAGRVGVLEEAQIHTEKALRQLTIQLGALAKEVGALSATVGFGLEDIAHVVLPGYLERHYGIHVDGFQRKFFNITSRGRVKEVEVNLYGEGQRNHLKIVILGEVKGRIHESDVRAFARLVTQLENQKQVLGEIFKLMFGYYVHPSGSKTADEYGIKTIASYQR